MNLQVIWTKKFIDYNYIFLINLPDKAEEARMNENCYIDSILITLTSARNHKWRNTLLNI